MTDFLVWADVETTGLDPNTEKLLEIAVIVTDTKLNEFCRYTRMVEYTPSEVEEMKSNCIPFVRDMHKTSGLWERLKENTCPDVTGEMEDIDLEIANMISSPWFTQNPTFYLAGNSVKLDFGFIQENLPQTFKMLHYRTIDMSTLQLTLGWWNNVDEYKKELRHEALADIEESLAQARYLKNRLTNTSEEPTQSKFTQDCLF